MRSYSLGYEHNERVRLSSIGEYSHVCHFRNGKLSEAWIVGVDPYELDEFFRLSCKRTVQRDRRPERRAVRLRGPSVAVRHQVVEGERMPPRTTHHGEPEPTLGQRQVARERAYFTATPFGCPIQCSANADFR